jgi:hypothetical protein
MALPYLSSKMWCHTPEYRPFSEAEVWKPQMSAKKKSKGKAIPETGLGR